jgi:hypothetical protein
MYATWRTFILRQPLANIGNALVLLKSFAGFRFGLQFATDGYDKQAAGCFGDGKFQRGGLSEICTFVGLFI